MNWDVEFATHSPLPCLIFKMKNAFLRPASSQSRILYRVHWIHMIRLRQEAAKNLNRKQYQVGAGTLRPRITDTGLNRTMVIRPVWEDSLSMWQQKHKLRLVFAIYTKQLTYCRLYLRDIKMHTYKYMNYFVTRKKCWILINVWEVFWDANILKLGKRNGKNVYLCILLNVILNINMFLLKDWVTNIKNPILVINTKIRCRF